MYKRAVLKLLALLLPNLCFVACLGNNDLSYCYAECISFAKGEMFIKYHNSIEEVAEVEYSGRKFGVFLGITRNIIVESAFYLLHGNWESSKSILLLDHTAFPDQWEDMSFWAKKGEFSLILPLLRKRAFSVYFGASAALLMVCLERAYIDDLNLVRMNSNRVSAVNYRFLFRTEFICNKHSACFEVSIVSNNHFCLIYYTPHSITPVATLNIINPDNVLQNVGDNQIEHLKYIQEKIPFGTGWNISFKRCLCKDIVISVGAFGDFVNKSIVRHVPFRDLFAVTVGVVWVI